MKDNFFIGAATAAHQVEGNNTNSDYWLQEQLPHSAFAEPSGIACDHYRRYAEDIALMQKAGLNAYRFSIEWARIEPEEGVFDGAEIEHYRDVIHCCKAHGIEPMVTLHHFTSPVWLIRKGGWEDASVVEYFRRYAVYVIKALGAELHYVCTINEANMGLQVAAIERRYRMMAEQAARLDSNVQVGINLTQMMENQRQLAAENAEVFGTPNPQVFVSSRTPEGDKLVMRAHEAARDAIKATYPQIQVGLTLSLHDIQALPGGEDAAAAAWDDEFLHYQPAIVNDDFLGVQNYSRMRYGPDGLVPPPESAKLTQMDYEDYPAALENVLRRVQKDFPRTLIVTENGIATDDDTRRVEFIREALAGVSRCKADGLPVEGYLYWSLLDNFEWQKGYAMQFGLVAVDRETLERKPKESLWQLRASC